MNRMRRRVLWPFVVILTSACVSGPEQTSDSGNRGQSPPSEVPSTLECEGAEGRRNAAAPGGDSQVVVYFSCSARAHDEVPPLYAFTRDVMGGIGLEERIEATVLAYLEGPRSTETKGGYTSALTAPGHVLHTIEIHRGSATLNFATTLLDYLGNVGTSTASQTFLRELQATVFQFEQLESLSLKLNGDCDAFWHLLEAECQLLSRDRAVLGVPYAFTLYTHCGVLGAGPFDGRAWVADPPLSDGSGNPPPGFTQDENVTYGSMTLVSRSVAEFKSRSQQAARFVPRPKGATDPLAACE